MITNRAEMAEKITQLTNENAVFVRENGVRLLCHFSFSIHLIYLFSILVFTMR